MTLWIRVRDNDTGHEFDVPSGRYDLLVARGAVREVTGGRHTGGRPRPPKYNVPMARVPAKPVKTTRTTTPGEPNPSDAR